jgi:hypothetical protein
MHIEAGNIERFSRNFKDSRELYIPKVYWDYTSKSILVMELIEGIRFYHCPAGPAWLFPCYRFGLLVDFIHIPIQENVGKIKEN